MNAYGFEPDFANLRKVLLGGRGHRVPNVELVIDREIKDAFMGSPVVTLAEDIAFRYQAGYDYTWVSIGMIDPAGTVNKDLVADGGDKHFQGADRRVWADEHSGVLSDLSRLDDYPWPDPAKLDYSPLVEARTLLPKGMKLIAILGKVFTASWQLTGFDDFMLKLALEPQAVAALVRRVGEIQLEVCRRVLQYDTVGAVWVPDDVAYHSGPMVSPAWLKEHVFSFYRRMGALCRQADKPFIYHSDGDMSLLIDEIIDCGFNALHPIEPESMDIYDLRRRVGRRLCLLGNIRVHSLVTESPAAIRELVRDRVTRLGHEGAYCVGSSNSVPNYVPIEHYKAMLQASADFGRIA
jgi:uroporphyrinogen decarboxylase